MNSPLHRRIQLAACLVLCTASCSKGLPGQARKQPSRPAFGVIRDTSRTPADILCTLELHRTNQEIKTDSPITIQVQTKNVRFGSPDTQCTIEWECDPVGEGCDDWRFTLTIDGAPPVYQGVKFCGSPVVVHQWSHYELALLPTDPFAEYRKQSESPASHKPGN